MQSIAISLFDNKIDKSRLESIEDQPHVRTTPFAARGQLGRNDSLPVVVGVGVSQLQISTRRVGVFLIPNCMPVVAGPHGRVGAHAWDPAGRPE